jgi:hypothetical protein
MSCGTIICVRGTCDTSGTIPVCVCEPGWGHDTSYFRQFNCGLPDYYLLGVAVTFSISCVVFLGLFLHATYLAHGRLRTIGMMCSGSIVFQIACLLALYLENGTFEATSILLAVFLASQSYISESIVFLTMGPAMMGTEKRARRFESRRVKIAMWTIRSIIVIAGIALAVIARLPSFNIGLSAYMMVLVVCANVSAYIQMKYVHELIATIQKLALGGGATEAPGSERNQEFVNVIHRLEKAQHSIKVHAVMISISQIIIVAIFWGLGQNIPYGFVIWILTLSAQPIRYYTCYIMLRKSKTSTNSSGSKSQRLSREGVVVASTFKSDTYT